MTTSANSLLVASDLPDFQGFNPSEVLPAIRALIERCETALEIATGPMMEPDRRQLSRVLEVPVEELSQAWSTVKHLHSVAGSPDLREAVKAAEPLVTAFYSKLSSNDRLYELYKLIALQGASNLSEPERQLVENNLRDFYLEGAELAPAGKQRFLEIKQRLSELSSQFRNNVVDATDEYVYWATPDELDGVPAEVMARLGADATAAGRQGYFKVTLHQPCLAPLLKSARRRDLRETLYRANATRASEIGPSNRDNGPLIAETMALRQELAKLLGLGTAADVSLVPKMADSPSQVGEFLRDLSHRARSRALAEADELKTFAQESLEIDSLEAWDVPFASEQLRRARYAFSEEEVRQHFSLDHVLAGLFDIAQRMHDISFHPEALVGWHPSVTAYRVERAGMPIGRLFLDPFARPGKSPGAWVNAARPRWRRPDGTLRLATTYLVTNFAQPAQGLPTLLSHGEVTTLFHEFGHSTHFLLSEVDVLGVSGLSGVEWDAVELPSQLMENFAWQWSTIERITFNPTTGRGLPRELFDKMLAARNFHVGLFIQRQVELALFDMRLHAEPARAGDAQVVFEEVRAEVAVLKTPQFNRFQNVFSHVFAGGYAAGYYSYLWADVMASDAWQVFEQSGGADRVVGHRYLRSILSRGGSRPMQESFKEFMGRQPTIDALLRQRGLSDSTVR